MDWLVLALLLFGALILYGGRHTVWAGMVVGLAVMGLLTIWLSRRLRYLVFRPHPQVRSDAFQGALEPDGQVRVRATGVFAVHGHERYLVDQPAVYTTPRSREHILMVKLESTRLLLLGKSDPEAWGWWYQFFRPDAIESTQMGQAVHGWRVRPAIRVVYWMEDEAERLRQVETVLSFDDLELRTLIWADILHDRRTSEPSP
jgi:hypothetical protein